MNNYFLFRNTYPTFLGPKTAIFKKSLMAKQYISCKCCQRHALVKHLTVPTNKDIAKTYKVITDVLLLTTNSFLSTNIFQCRCLLLKMFIFWKIVKDQKILSRF